METSLSYHRYHRKTALVRHQQQTHAAMWYLEVTPAITIIVIHGTSCVNCEILCGVHASFIFRGAKPLWSQKLARLLTESYKSWCLLNVFQQDARLNQVSAPYQWVHGKALKQTIGSLSWTAVHHLHTCQPTNATNHSGLWPCERPRLDNVSTQESRPQTLQTGPHTISVIISTWTWKWKPSEQFPAMLTSLLLHHERPATKESPQEKSARSMTQWNRIGLTKGLW